MTPTEAKGVAPITVLTKIEEAVRSETLGETFTPEEVDTKRVELARAVKDLPYDDSMKVVAWIRLTDTFQYEVVECFCVGDPMTEWADDFAHGRVYESELDE